MERDPVASEDVTSSKPKFRFVSTLRMLELNSYGFNIDVLYHGKEKRVVARYSEMLAIHQKLKETFRGDKHAKFPSRFGTITFFGSEEEKIDKRRVELEQYFNSLKEEYFELPDLVQLFKLSSMNKPVEEDKAVSFRINNLAASVPEILITENGEEYFAGAIVMSVTENINQLEDIRHSLANEASIQRKFTVLENTSSRRASIMQALNEFQSTIDTLRLDASLQQQEEFQRVLNILDTYIGIASSWEEHVGETVMNQFTQQTNDKNKSAVQIRMEDYMREAEDIVANFATKPKSELKEEYKRIGKLFGDLGRDISIYQNRQDGPSIVSRLEQIKKYVRDSTQAIGQSSTSLGNPSSIPEVEKRLFQLLEEISNHEGGNEDVEKQTKLKEKLVSLIRDIRDLKRYFLQLEGAEHKSSINRLEDLQENLSELEYTFNNKFDTNQNLEEKAQQAVKKYQENTKTRQISRAQDDLFGL